MKVMSHRERFLGIPWINPVDVPNAWHGYSVVVAPYTLDSESVPDVRARVQSALDDVSPWLLVDLAVVDFIDAAGLGMLLWARRRAHNLAGEVLLIQPAPVVARLLTEPYLEHLFRTYPSVDDVPPVPKMLRTQAAR